MSNPNSRTEIESLKTKISTLLNKQLQNICQVSGLKTSGVKADLQKRIIYALYENVTADPANYLQIKEAINNVMAGSGRGSNHTSSPAPSYGRGSAFVNVNSVNGNSHTSASPHLQTPVFSPNGFPGYGGAGARSAGGFAASASPVAAQQRPGTMPFRQSYHGNPQGLINRSALQFKPSPFYRPEHLVGSVKTLEIMTQHRNSTTVTLKTSEHQALTRCLHDKSLRIMIFCAGEDRGLQDIAFPHQSELKVNGGEIKANLRGLKGKAGSTRPVDITGSLRLDKPSYVNNIEFTYALTTKVKKNCASQKFYFAIYLCKLIPVEELVAKIKGRKIPKASILKELSKAANDPDVVATSQVLSLKCPLTYGRLKNPCRSTTCSHIQCFDVTSYLYLQEQGPQWICPICNKSATFENLAVDEYVKDILDRTHEDTEQVTIETDGVWRVETSDPEPKKSRVSAAHSMASIKVDDDDDIVALDDFSSPIGGNPQAYHGSMAGTPSGARANGSSSTPGGSRKRTAEIIDLTLSDDDEPIRPPTKRQQTAGASSLAWSYPAAYHNS